MKQKRQGFLYGAIVLAAGTIVVKLVGALFKIPLTNLLGGVGMSYFNVAYDLYYPLYALFVSGVPIAVSRLVSESIARGRAKDARKLLRVSAAVFVGIGAVGAGLMVLGAQGFSQLVHNPDAKYAVMMLSPALFFGCIMAALRGYWQGMQDMTPTAISQIVEVLAKLIFGLILAYGVTVSGMREFAATGTVFGKGCASYEQAHLLVLPYAAAGAILGVTASAMCGAIYMVVMHKLRKGGVYGEALQNSLPAASSKILAKRLLAIAVPVCVASVIANLTSFIDLISVMNRLSSAISAAPQIVWGMYEGAVPSGIGAEQLASYLYGCYSGLAVPVYNLVPALTATIGVSLLPAVTTAWTTRNRSALERNIGSSLRLAALVAMPAGIGICALAEPILRFLFFSRPMEVTVIAPALRLMGISAIFVALSLPVNAVLQALGRADLPVKLLFMGGLVKLLLNFLLVAVPQLNIQAAPIGTLACYTLVLGVSLSRLITLASLKLSLKEVLGKPFFAAVCCGMAAWASYGLLERWLPERISTLAGVGIGGVVYLMVVLLTRTITKEDLLMVPGTEKFVKLLAKHHLLG